MCDNEYYVYNTPLNRTDLSDIKQKNSFLKIIENKTLRNNMIKYNITKSHVK